MKRHIEGKCDKCHETYSLAGHIKVKGKWKYLCLKCLGEEMKKREEEQNVR